MISRFAQFGPGAAERITGVSADLQRTWRKRGFLPARADSRTSFSTLDLAALMIRMQLVHWGISPSTSIYDPSDSLSMLWFALMNIDETCEVSGPALLVSEFEQKWHDQTGWIAHVIKFREDSVNRYFAVDSKGKTFRFSDSGRMQDFSATSSLLIIDLMNLGEELAKGSDSVLLHVEITDGSNGRAQGRRKTIRLARTAGNQN